MKNIILLLFCFITLYSNAQKSESVKDVVKFQEKINKDYTDKEKSPLTKEDFKTFKSLDFFNIDTNYRVIAKLEYPKNSKPFAMKTSTSRLPIYKVFAIATFKIKDVQHKLNIYQNQQLILTTGFEDYLFLPFTDKTNGDSSYGGGRYIDLEVTDEETIIIDFNKAYNPYCAYNDRYSCPIPPKENQLDIEIPVGVKAYKGY